MANSAAKQKTKTGILVERLTRVVDEQYDRMSAGEIAASQDKLKAIRDRLRVSHEQKRETA